ncbi:MAG: methyltransferase domain-containing protein [Oligoflexus sp.]|nr:methyltransferase domain-containing protein [Oligoflexus sp.]
MDNSSWKRIQKLRQSYLDAKAYLPDYWQDDELLLAYDETLAQRIRWKWRAVLEALPVPVSELPKTIVDWGCGSGGASRELLHLHPESFEKVVLLDRSTRAVKFAARKVKDEHPKITIDSKVPSSAEPFLLLISHVLSELPDEELKKLLPLLRKASHILWVESGRPQESRKLSALREDLRDTHVFLAPCPHQNICGMLSAGQEENWCHFKAPVPKEVHLSAFWREASKQLGFDLRSLPVAYLFAQARTLSLALPSNDRVRILGGSRQFKGYTRFHACHISGIVQADFMKRKSKKIYEALAEPALDSLYEHRELFSSESGEDESDAKVE